MKMLERIRLIMKLSISFNYNLNTSIYIFKINNSLNKFSRWFQSNQRMNLNLPGY